MAKSAKDALRIERTVHADEVWIDEDWKKNNVFEGEENKKTGYQH